MHARHKCGESCGASECTRVERIESLMWPEHATQANGAPRCGALIDWSGRCCAVCNGSCNGWNNRWFAERQCEPENRYVFHIDNRNRVAES